MAIIALLIEMFAQKEKTSLALLTIEWRPAADNGETRTIVVASSHCLWFNVKIKVSLSIVVYITICPLQKTYKLLLYIEWCWL
jgi:hypothetical protein